MAATLLVFLIDGRCAKKVLEDLIMAAQGVPVNVKLAVEQPEITPEDLEGVNFVACSLDTATHVRRLGWKGPILGVLTQKPNDDTLRRIALLRIKQHEVYPQFRPFHMPEESAVCAA